MDLCEILGRFRVPEGNGLELRPGNCIEEGTSQDGLTCKKNLD
ncbi:hypothetical protein Lalb_Chr17g0337101 [Lupinus albus]|uniref:Uncharacterized protein n=1 Tax=Lupinus albus TaxID=3870 RepID=A0A6A4P8W7_LUPAL|nr:hypothetical protein Lalb_Chr17g0337101 [Lupinus albus]